ncbi:MAG: DsbE family thiol:disulfide interchange protein [Alphaproteobacteria bacterium]
MKRLLAIAPLVVLALLATSFGLMLSRGGGQQSFDTQRLLGEPAPAFTLQKPDGAGVLTSADLRGKPYVLNFFASYCVPCRAEHPMLTALSRQGVTVIGVNYKDKPEEMRKMLAQLGDPFAAIGEDPAGQTGLDYGITGIPESVVVGADGRILALHRSALDAETVNQKIMPAISKGAFNKS